MTEIVCALGLGDALVGVSYQCDWLADGATMRARHAAYDAAFRR